jgi:hypothetical protein
MAVPRTKHPELANLRHGMARTPVYKVWDSMMQRCYNPKCHAFPEYGGRGIDVDQLWHKFIPFYADMGWPPTPHHTIERIDNSLGYSKTNYCWATMKEQARNRRNTRLLSWNGTTQCVKDWALEFHMKPVTLFARLRRGMSLEQAITTPLRPLFPG